MGYKKGLSQNFLMDPVTAGRLAASCRFRPDDVVVEIGAGDGRLSGLIAASGARLLAVEIDRDLIPALRERLVRYPRAQAVIADARDIRLDRLAAAAGRRLRVFGNLPYHLSSVLYLQILSAFPDVLSFHLMFQREVAERILGSSGPKSRGFLFALTRFVADVRKVAAVPAGAFFPAPDVGSMFIEGTIRPDPDVTGREGFETARRVVDACFASRRKTLQNALADSRLVAGWVKADYARAIIEAGIDPGCRAEQLDHPAMVSLVGRLAAGLDRPDD